ncbi:hypothetical protein MYAM1_002147 [Malassezia yamatoensis]|uniref:PX domain-containing protein n=1 Tax=Malassezia yamatoensis TaxID=253288 RepID=A0AAJ6CI21_9BASI|nr:hypothetical protein MYAM1_002147 [Malassezia yamatoensis]
MTTFAWDESSDANDAWHEPVNVSERDCDAGHATNSMHEERPKDVIHILDAYSSSEHASVSYIVYVVQSPGNEVKRRYSEFESLREALVQLHPTLIIPPIPTKHTLADYAVKQTKAKDDPAIIAHRKRTLQRFLNRCYAHPVLRQDVVLLHFLDPRFSWTEVKTSPPLSELPKTNLNACPRQPADTEASLAYKALPTPTVARPLREPNERFQESEAFTKRFESQLSNRVELAQRRLVRRWHDIATDYADLGASFNAQSLSECKQLAPAVERVGQAADATYLAYNEMLAGWDAAVSEPLHEYTQYAKILGSILRWRHLKQQQLEEAQEQLATKQQQLADLEYVEAEHARLSSAMEIGRNRSSSAQADPQVAVQPRRSVYGQAAESGEQFADPHEAAQATDAQHSPSLATMLPPAKRPGVIRSLSQALQNMMDVDPDKTRQTSISKLREEVMLLAEGIQLAEPDLKQSNETIQASLDRFQRLKVADLHQMLIDMAQLQRNLCEKNLSAWKRARQELSRTPSEAFGDMPNAHLDDETSNGHSKRNSEWLPTESTAWAVTD